MPQMITLHLQPIISTFLEGRQINGQVPRESRPILLGTGVRLRFSKHPPFIYLIFLKIIHIHIFPLKILTHSYNIFHKSLCLFIVLCPSLWSGSVPVRACGDQSTKADRCRGIVNSRWQANQRAPAQFCHFSRGDAVFDRANFTF